MKPGTLEGAALSYEAPNRGRANASTKGRGMRRGRTFGVFGSRARDTHPLLASRGNRMRRLIIIQPHKPDSESVEPIEVEFDRMVEIESCAGRHRIDGVDICEIRMTYEFAHHAIYLNSSYEWVIGKDSDGITCLVPLEKK